MASSKREKELARQRAERQAARRAAAIQRRKQRRLVIASVVAVLVLVGAATAAALTLTGGDDDVVATEPAPTPAASGACEYVKSDTPPARPAELPPTEGVEREAVFDVTLTTNRGTIVFETLTAEAPCTVQSLRHLAHLAFFDKTPCHRLTTQGISVLQCGSPDGSPNGGPGYSFADENLDGATYPRGTVAMANAGASTNGSQFFLVYEDSELPPNYTPFGKITKGLEVLEKVAAAGADDSTGPGDGKPKLPVEIQTLRVRPQAA